MAKDTKTTKQAPVTKGGSVKMTAGAGGGLGRLQKIGKGKGGK